MTAIVCREYDVENNCYVSTADRAILITRSKFMNLTELKWTKNVNHQGDDKYWAYQNIDQNLNIFRLNWKTEQAKNARRPQESELILLRQRTKITHIVKLLNNTLYQDPDDGKFSISRLVEVVWIADDWSVAPEQDMVFGYHVHLHGGKVMKLETPTFNEHWGSQGGLVGFQNHVASEYINLKSK
jgi:hypothetical protein